MKLTIILLVSLFIVSTAYAGGEWSVKAGYSDVLCDPIQSGVRVDCGYEIRNEKVGILGGVGYEFHKIRQVGMAHLLEYYVTGKLYTPSDIYIGLGVGYVDTFMVESYDVQADIDDEIGAHVVLGKNFGNWIIEGRLTICDLDMETSLPYETEIEKDSRLDSVVIQIGRRF